MTADTPRQESRDRTASGPPIATGAAPERAREPWPDIGPGGAPWTLMYHSVDEAPEDPYQLTVTPARFARQMAWLQRRGLRGVAIAELLAAHAIGRAAGLVGLTFDDGYADLPGQVLPVLERYGFTATAYVVAGRLGSHNTWDADAPRKPLMSREQVRAVARRGLEIGSHGLNHRPLRGLPPEQLALETGRSRELLEDLLERPVTGFCYPYGALDRQAVAAVRDSGYSHAVAIDHCDLTGRWALPRCYVGERDGAGRLCAKRARHRVRAWRRADRGSMA
ncbi:polysaccharide deacetylase family protein [Streptacidiphilus sp. P02-A3a]|uniref:polysaccharide deacetylase family protein n=1 Tax=Streptacidiphilus sp. P02-A3a TaxID=2704468 RepID=UPI0015FB1653|nr:polysaccharide deacetylase family protein [Streptacidiphilus sp. P02-A3a]QMU71940.1 polysaccharide deacetylase family protein [Streptacidiphilus sp. P02-A3a]